MTIFSHPATFTNASMYKLSLSVSASKSSIPPASLPAIGSFRNQSVKSIMNSSNLPANVSNSSFTYEQYSAEPSKKAKTLDPSGLTSQLPTGSCPRYDDGCDIILTLLLLRFELFVILELVKCMLLFCLEGYSWMETQSELFSFFPFLEKVYASKLSM